MINYIWIFYGFPDKTPQPFLRNFRLGFSAESCHLTQGVSTQLVTFNELIIVESKKKAISALDCQFIVFLRRATNN